MMVPTLYNYLMEERDGEWDTVGFASLNNLEIILIVLAKAVAIHMRVTIIKVGKPSLEGLFARTRPVILHQQFNGSCIYFQELLIQLFGRTYG